MSTMSGTTVNSSRAPGEVTLPVQPVKTKPRFGEAVIVKVSPVWRSVVPRNPGLTVPLPWGPAMLTVSVVEAPGSTPTVTYKLAIGDRVEKLEGDEFKLIQSGTILVRESETTLAS